MNNKKRAKNNKNTQHNDNKKNNAASNLKWGTNQQNSQEAYDTGANTGTQKVEITNKSSGQVTIYKKLKDEMARTDALIETQREFRDGKIKGPNGEDYTHPFYWAPFQLTGDWRPIENL